jgi:hypothetical protein
MYVPDVKQFEDIKKKIFLFIFQAVTAIRKNCCDNYFPEAPFALLSRYERASITYWTSEAAPEHAPLYD